MKTNASEHWTEQSRSIFPSGWFGRRTSESKRTKEQPEWMTGFWISTFEASLTTWITRWLRAVRRYTHCRWILLYVQRWLEAPLQQPDRSLVPRTKGTAQGGVISPLLANIFLHLAFDD